jgi:hypothetical protein
MTFNVNEDKRGQIIYKGLCDIFYFKMEKYPTEKKE